MSEITDDFFDGDESDSQSTAKPGPEVKFVNPRDPRHPERQRRLKLIPFDWQQLPRIDWPHGNVYVHSFEGWPIPQPNGRKLLVETVHQEFIYAGALLGGLSPPTEYLLRAIARAEKLYPNEKSAPVMLPPTLYQGRRVRIIDGRDESYDWVSLPRVCCIAGLFSTKPARDENEVFSSAVVIWFQDHFGMADEQVQAQLAQLDWAAIASDWCP